MNQLNKIVIAKYLIDNFVDHPFIVDIHQSHGLSILDESTRKSRNFLLAVASKIGTDPEIEQAKELTNNVDSELLVERFLENDYKVCHSIPSMIFMEGADLDLIVITDEKFITLNGSFKKTDIEQLVHKYNILYSEKDIELRVLPYSSSNINLIVNNFDKLLEGNKIAHRLQSPPVEVKDTSRNGTGTYAINQAHIPSFTKNGNVLLFNPNKSFAVLVEGKSKKTYVNAIAESFAIDAA